MLLEVAVSSTATFVVQPLKERVIPLSLQETDSVSGSFSVVSDDDTGINFYVVDWQNQTILRSDNIKQKNFSFTAKATGNYLMNFDNSVSADYGKTVTLNYDVTHYIMGLPQEQFLLIVIAIVAILGAIIYVALMPK